MTEIVVRAAGLFGTTVFAEVELPSRGGIVAIDHKLGRVPQWCVLWELVRPKHAETVSVFAASAPLKKNLWTANQVVVDVYNVGIGSLDGCTGRFLLGGE